MKFYPTYLQSFGLLLILLLCGILSVLITLPFYSNESGIGLSFAYILTMIATISVALFLRRRFVFPWKAVPPGLVFVGALTTLCLHLFLNPITSLVPVPDSLVRMLKDTIQHPLPFFVMIVIAAPVLEELLFRGIILEGLLKNYQPYRAIGFSAFLFALVHGNLAQGIGAFMIGVLVGWIYWKTESIIPGILIHFINNLAAYSAILFSNEDDLFKSFSDQLGNPLLYWSLIAGGGLVAGLGIWLLYRHFQNKRIDLAFENEVTIV
jgi:membrane protease YdiL (CAAX protease family)